MPPSYLAARGLIFGGLLALVDVEVMSEVDAVLSLVEYGKINEEIFPICVDGRPHLRIPLGNEDLVTFEQNVDVMYNFIRAHNRNGSTVLVHCMAGHNRSAAVVLFYLLQSNPDEFTSIGRAVAYLKKINPDIRVNPVYLKFLENYFFSMSSTDES